MALAEEVLAAPAVRRSAASPAHAASNAVGSISENVYSASLGLAASSEEGHAAEISPPCSGASSCGGSGVVMHALDEAAARPERSAATAAAAEASSASCSDECAAPHKRLYQSSQQASLCHVSSLSASTTPSSPSRSPTAHELQSCAATEPAAAGAGPGAAAAASESGATAAAAEPGAAAAAEPGTAAAAESGAAAGAGAGRRDAVLMHGGACGDKAYFRSGRVLVVRALSDEPLGCMYSASPAAEEENCSSALSDAALEKFRSCFEQSRGSAEGVYRPASVLLRRVFTTAAALRPVGSSMRASGSLSSTASAAAAASPSAATWKEVGPSATPEMRNSSSFSNDSVNAEGGQHEVSRHLKLPGHTLSSSPTAAVASSSSSPSSTCLPSSSISSSPAAVHHSKDVGCSSSFVFPRAAEVEALARHPVMVALGVYIRRGGVVALPTETVYGLGAAATLPDACKKVYTLKGRPPSDPLICHVASTQQAFDDAFDLDSDDEDTLAAQQPNKTLLLKDIYSAPSAAFCSRETASESPAAAASNSDGSVAPSGFPAACNNSPAACNNSPAASGECTASALSCKSPASAGASVCQSAAAAVCEKEGRRRRLEEKRGMRLLVKALADAFWPGPLSIVAPGKILEDQREAHSYLLQQQQQEEGMKKKKETQHVEERIRRCTENEEETTAQREGEPRDKQQTPQPPQQPPKGVALAVTSGTRLVAVRCPCHKYALALALAAGVPIAAPSANLFGRISPTRAQHVLSQFGETAAAWGNRCSSSSSNADLQKKRDALGIQLNSSSSSSAVESDNRTKRRRNSNSSSSGIDSEVGSSNHVARRRPEAEGLPLFSGEDFALLDVDGEDEWCCVGIESTVVKVGVAARPSAAAVAAADASCSSCCYEVQVLRRGVVTPDMLQNALDAAAAHYNSSRQQQQQRQQQQRVSAQERAQKRADAAGETEKAFPSTAFPRFVVTVSPKLQFHTHAEQARRGRSLSSAVASPQAGDCSKQQSVSCETESKCAPSPSIFPGGVEDCESISEKQKLSRSTGATPALLPCESAALKAAASTAESMSSVCKRTGGGAGISPAADASQAAVVAHANTELSGDVTTLTARVKTVHAGSHNMAENSAIGVREKQAGAELPHESPGMALTHYAPCVPCFLVSASSFDMQRRRASSNSSSCGDSTLERPSGAVDACENSNKRLCTRSDAAPFVGHVEAASCVSAGHASEAGERSKRNLNIACRESILIDAGEDFAAFGSHFLRYFSLVKLQRNSRRHHDASDAAAAGAASSGVKMEAPSREEDEAKLLKEEEVSSSAERRRTSRGISEKVEKKDEQELEERSQEEAMSNVWTQAAACSIFETLHSAEALALKEGARAIFIHAEPLVRGAEHGLAVYDRLYRAASGKHAFLELQNVECDDASPFTFVVN